MSKFTLKAKEERMAEPGPLLFYRKLTVYTFSIHYLKEKDFLMTNGYLTN